MITLTPQARAIAAFTVAVLLLLGELNKIAFGIVLLFGSSYPDGRGGRFLTSLLLVAIAAAVVYFTMGAATAVAAGTGWDTHLAKAAVLVAVLGLVIAIVVGIGSVANNLDGSPANFGSGLFF